MNGVLIEILSRDNDRPKNQWLESKNLLFVFLTAATIAEQNPETITGNVLAKLLNILAQAEIEEGGPYRSFFDSGENDIDIAVNAAIAYFLDLQKVSLPSLDKLIEEAISSENFHSRFFASDIPAAYLLAKFYRGRQKQKLINWIRRQEYQNNLDRKLAAAIVSLSANKQNDIPHGSDQSEKQMIAMIMELAHSRLSGLSRDFQTTAMREIEKTIQGNPDKQMPLIAYYTKIALGKKGCRITDKMIAQMGLANIFFWTAFIIYDNFWDNDEEALPTVLPAANLFARHYVDFFGSLFPKQTGFSAWFHQLMDDLDCANNWETANCRAEVANGELIIPETLPDFGNYEFKYRPSSGHILGPVAIFRLAGYGNAEEIKNLTDYFKNYLIAMQINDDIHDWLEDMRRGHLTTVTAMLLEDWRREYPANKKIDLETDLKKMQRLFWFNTIKRAAKTILDHTNRSRQALYRLTAPENLAPLERYITINENAAKLALAERQKSIDFLNQFHD